MSNSCHVFVCKCFVLRTHQEQLRKFKVKDDEGIFVGYSLTNKTFKVYNLITKTIVGFLYVSFDGNKLNRIRNENDHEILRFENEGLNSNGYENFDIIPNSDDFINFDYTEDSDQSSSKNTIVEGEKLSESIIGP